MSILPSMTFLTESVRTAKLTRQIRKGKHVLIQINKRPVPAFLHGRFVPPVGIRYKQLHSTYSTYKSGSFIVTSSRVTPASHFIQAEEVMFRKRMYILRITVDM